MENYKLIIFDLDGTLVDSIQDYTEATNRLLSEYHRDPVSIDTVTYHIGHGLRRYVCDLFPERTHNEEGMETVASEFFAHYDKVCLENTFLYEGVSEFLEKWTGLTAVVTNKAEVHAKKILAHLLPKQEFLTIYGADSLPERKPHPLPLLETVKTAALNVDQALMVGDSKPDILAARAAKMKVVATSYGYSDLASLENLKPDYLIDHFSMLNQIVRN